MGPLTIDASVLPDGITIDANNQSRVFQINSGTGTVTLRSLMITGGDSDRGGGLRIGGSGICLLDRITIAANEASLLGGGIYTGSSVDVRIEDSTISGNSSPAGGAIASFGDLTLLNTTLTANEVTDSAGAIRASGSNSTVLLTHCTVTSNISRSGDQGGIRALSSINELILSNSLIAGNTGEDLSLANNSKLTLEGSNLLGNNKTVSGITALAQGTPNLAGHYVGTNTSPLDPQLAPLGWYGGPTPTMPPLPGSHAIDTATALDPIIDSDQRGYSRPNDSVPDIGAAEYQGHPDLALFWPLDWDGDGSSFGLEQALGTDPLVSDSAHSANPVFSRNPDGHTLFTFGRGSSPVSGTVWRVTRSLDLRPDSFQEIYRFNGSTSTLVDDSIEASVNQTFITVADTSPPPGQAFYRIEALLPGQ